ncbi:SLOG family protein [Streptomyces albidoflavus]|uniref:SLOG family protein n=1 Tax=Streptomyces albidoflavus TaxID=1886 RepID=UPI00101E565C|nr:SLOG family protein [Streptomyces albidoflavus]RZD80932.1 hypothetical protein C0Q60_14880 [Streptomyces albidoflavus]RZD98502.1 hypothetical protein C0Q62_14760 [Streptomyces albidoflavus]
MQTQMQGQADLCKVNRYTTVLVCGSRRWPWPQAVEAVLDRLANRYGKDLVVIEGAATGADRAAHDWCGRHSLGEDRHRGTGRE